MARSYSLDLRERVVAAVLAGATTRAAAARFGVSVATAVRWAQRARSGKGLAPDKRGGRRPSPLVGEIAAWLRARVAEKRDITLRALTAELAARGTAVHVRSVWRFMRREGLSFKKNAAGDRAGWVQDRKVPRPLENPPAPA